MAFVATDKNGDEYVFSIKPERFSNTGIWYISDFDLCKLPSGTIKKLIGRDLSFDDEPVELT